MIFKKNNAENLELIKNLNKKYELGLCDLLAFRFFADEGIIYNIDGSFQQSFYIVGYDFESSEPVEINAVVNYICMVFSLLDTGWVFSYNNIRYKVNEYPSEDNCEYNHKILEYLDNERRIFFEEEANLYHDKLAFTLCYKPMENLFKKGSSLFKESNKEIIKHDPYLSGLKYFKGKIKQITRLLSRVFKINFMNDDETLTYLRWLLTGRYIETRLPKEMYTEIRHYLAEDFISGYEPKIGNKHIRVVTIDEGFPPESVPLMFERLRKCNFAWRLNTRFFFITNIEAQKELSDLSEMHEQNMLSFRATLTKELGGAPKINRSTVDFIDEVEELKRRVVKSEDITGKFNCSIVLYDEDEELLRKHTDEVMRIFEGMQFKVRLEGMNAQQAYLGSIDGERYANKRKFTITTENFAEFLPISNYWKGYRKHPSELYGTNSPPLFVADTPQAGYFYGSLHYHTKGHSLILGNNKELSSLVVFLAFSQLKYKDSAVYILDNLHSALPFTYAIGGKHYDIGYDNLMFQPFSDLDTADGKDFAINFAISICEVNGFKLDTKHLNHIKETIQSLSVYPKDLRTMDGFLMLMSSKDVPLAEVFKGYTGHDSLRGKIFNSNDDKMELSRINVFEMSKVLEQKDSVTIPMFEYIFYKIRQNLRGNPVTIFINDSFIAFENPVARKKLLIWLNTFERLNVNIVMMSNSIDQIDNSPIRDTLMQQCNTIIYSPNKQLVKDHVRNIYYHFGLNSAQLDLLSNATPNIHYYLVNPEGAKLFNLNFDDVPMAKALMCKNDIPSIAYAKKIYKDSPDTFFNSWLEYNGLSEYQI
ncbi:MAG: hypothetical protein ACK5Z5_06575 [Neisseriaceae bacterium]